MAILQCVRRGIVALAVVTSCACATLANGRHQPVQVVSTPTGADVWMNGTHVGTTPVTVRMRRRGDAMLRFERPGYRPVTEAVGRRPSWWSLGNLVFLNPLAAQGLDSVGQWVTFATLHFAGAVALDQASGGNSVRPRVIAVVLTPHPPD
jgi:hypothetical protein